MVLVIDNYGSFTYNLVQLLECLNQEVEVYRNDRIDVPSMKALRPAAGRLPAPEELVLQLREAGFDDARARSLFPGEKYYAFFARRPGSGG